MSHCGVGWGWGALLLSRARGLPYPTAHSKTGFGRFETILNGGGRALQSVTSEKCYTNVVECSPHALPEPSIPSGKNASTSSCRASSAAWRYHPSTRPVMPDGICKCHGTVSNQSAGTKRAPADTTEHKVIRTVPGSWLKRSPCQSCQISCAQSSTLNGKA